MASAYNHNKKAGNEGDICKHPALIAALDETVSRSRGATFRYADLFAGYAMNPIAKGNEWTRGIGVISGEHLSHGNPHVAFWAKCAGLEKKFTEAYPGSAWFAREVCRSHDRPSDLWLWETAPAPYESLKNSFPSAHIFDVPARHDELALLHADLVFVDPPDKSHWPMISALVRHLEPDRGVLIWLPIGVNATVAPPKEDQLSRRCREEALGLGMAVSTIRWANGGHTMGCQLLYRLHPEAISALRAAVDDIVACARRRIGVSPKWRYSPVHHNPSHQSY